MAETGIKNESVNIPSGDSGQETTEAETAGAAAEEKYRDLEEAAGHKVDPISGKWAETAEETRQGGTEAGAETRGPGAAVVHAISENLLPTIVTGIGIAWLTAGVLKDRTEAGRKLTAESSRRAREIESRFEEKRRQANEKAREMKERVREGSRRTKDKSREMVAEKTFLIAGALAGVGLLMGLALPETRKEKKLMNKMREEIQHAQETPEGETA